MDSLVGDKVKDKAEIRDLKAQKEFRLDQGSERNYGILLFWEKDPQCLQIQTLALKANSSP